jgi:hypothetical protein
MYVRETNRGLKPRSGFVYEPGIDELLRQIRGRQGASQNLRALVVADGDGLQS